MPSTRAVAAAVGISRNTVVDAFEQLVAEGYLLARERVGLFVAAGLARNADAASSAVSPATPKRVATRNHAPFEPGVPDLDSFPDAAWRRIQAELARKRDGAWDYADPAGVWELRAAIADHVAQSRGVRVRAESIVICEGTHAGFALTCGALCAPGDAVALEDPGYNAAKRAALAYGLRPVPVPVDHEGARIGETSEQQIRIVYVTPAHQFPLGVRMSAPRRTELLERARAWNATIFEDDYDAEFRYGIPPVAALQTLDGAALVVYAGTFSKVLAPALRIGYLIVPDSLLDAFLARRDALGGGPSPFLQSVLARYITQGQYAKHVRRMTEIYGERRARLVDALERECGSRLRIAGNPTGLHITALLDETVDDTSVARRAREAGLGCDALSSYALQRRRSGLVLGFGNASAASLTAGAAQLAQLLS